MWGHSMAILHPCAPWTKLQLLTSCSSRNQPEDSPSRGRRGAIFGCKGAILRPQIRFFQSAPPLGFRVKQKPSPSRRSTEFVSSFLFKVLNSQQECCCNMSAVGQSIFGGGYSVGQWSMTALWDAGSVSQVSCRRSFRVGIKDKFRKVGRRRNKLEERIQKGFQKVGLERQLGELPEWSAYVPYVAGGMEALVIVSWAIFLKGDLRGSTMFNLSGEGLLTLSLGTNFIVGWLASQMSSWKVEALSPSLLGRDKKAARPSIVNFVRSFLVNLIPYGNFLAWTRFGWKEGNSVSSVNAFVYVVPSLLKLVLWSRGLSVGKVAFLAWVLGAIHRPYDAARVQNERLLDVANARMENATKANEEKDVGEKGPELSVEEMAFLQERKELEEFDVLLARSTNSASSIPGPPQDWSVGDTLQWLGTEGFARYSSTFAENDIDGAILLLLTADDIRDELGIQSLGDRRRLEQAIQRLKSPR